MSGQTVPYGIFWGRTYAQLQAIKVNYDAAVDASMNQGALTGASVNGQSFSFAGRDYTLEEFGVQLQAAMSYLRPDLVAAPPSDRSAVRFPSHCYPRGW